mgnify:CR=1 FL=1
MTDCKGSVCDIRIKHNMKIIFFQNGNWEKNVLIPPFIDVSGKINESKSIVYKGIIIIQLSNGLDKHVKNAEGEWS